MVTSDARCSREIKSRIAMTKAAFSKKKALFTSTFDLNLGKKRVNCHIWSIALCGVETWTLRKVDQKYLENFEMWCWRRMENISCTDRVRNGEVLHRVKEEINILNTIKRRKANWIAYIWRRNSLLKHVIKGKIDGRIEVTARRERRRQQLLDDLKEKRGCWKFKDESLIRTLWRTRFGPAIRQTAEWSQVRAYTKGKGGNKTHMCSYSFV
jgi:hypothetical protein